MESVAGGCQLGFGRREAIEEQSYSLYSWHCLAAHLCLSLCWAERCDGILLPFRNRLILFCIFYPSKMAQQIWFCTISFTCFQRFNLQFFENHCIIFFINPIAFVTVGQNISSAFQTHSSTEHLDLFWQLRLVHMTRRSWLISAKIPNNGALWQRSGCYLQVPLELCRSQNASLEKAHESLALLTYTETPSTLPPLLFRRSHETPLKPWTVSSVTASLECRVSCCWEKCHCLMTTETHRRLLSG